ncbi:MAG: hypothetical protein Athens101410_732 [Parcubacteria group bacterium Athens1014_10]|nr:MAG: hypothetical protein Athens101410_732 [Parcubacteria group bacterium Athens1014_10]TSD05205.1 MAG: hypothetical protein Athens071412_403 [Parcubacteria group bacterium Athens0714_12]
MNHSKGLVICVLVLWLIAVLMVVVLPLLGNKRIMQGLHDLKRIRVVGGPEISGSFFLGCGSVSSGNFNSVRFWWQDNTAPEIYYCTTLDFDSVIVVEDETLEFPKVEFIDYEKYCGIRSLYGKLPESAKIYTPSKYWEFQIEDLKTKF